MQESIVFLLRVQCRRKVSSRSLSYIMMSFLVSCVTASIYRYQYLSVVVVIFSPVLSFPVRYLNQFSVCR